MESYVVLLFILLLAVLIVSSFHNHPYAYFFRFLRFTITLIAISFYGYWLTRDFIQPFNDKLTEVKIINKLPQPLDFHLILVEKDAPAQKQAREERYREVHSGMIRPEHYRPEYIDTTKFSEFWVIAYRGKKELVYFTRNIPKPENNAIQLDVENYTVENNTLSKKAESILETNKLKIISNVVWMTLSVLLIFINLTLAYQKK